MIIMIVGRLWQMGLQACILIFVLLVIQFFLRKYPKIYSYPLWILAGISLLCPIRFQSPFSLQPELAGSMLPGGGGGNGGGQKTQELVPKPLPDAIPLDGLHQTQVQPKDTQNETSHVQAGSTGQPDAQAAGIQDIRPHDTDNGKAPFPNLLAAAYLAGAGIAALCCLVQYQRMRRRIAAAVRIGGNVWLCGFIQSPFVIGIICPKIILPYGLDSMEEAHVLRHERTHIRHHDPFIRSIGLLCICLHWWNPLVWLAVYKMNQDMEMFCDESTLRRATLEERKSYARTLLSFAERQSGFSISPAFGKSNTERRVKNIMKKRKNNLIILFCVVLLAAFCAAAFMTVPKTADADNPQNLPGAGDPESNPLKEDGGPTGSQEDSGQLVEIGDMEDGNAKGREAMLAAYTSILNGIYYGHVWPDGQPCPLDQEDYDMSQNHFAICDIDLDGKDELVIDFTNSYMAGMVTKIYDYDGGSDTAREEFAQFPALTFYDNGIVEALASHNHGMAATFDDFWPYTLYQYDPVSDNYIQIANVDAWDKAWSETDYNGNPFPEEADLDGDGVVYFPYLAGTGTNLVFDGGAYQEWRDSYIGGSNPLVIPYQDMTEENINNIK